ncbi:Zn-dependent amino-or carboxypeptidase, M28 family [Fontimonas thermophila]|uniref:Zn-dependent amino-or carboxypeptidase, M28 family n=1 Tax=Fontimonas thermophila TaxID=1076937 RepID=A0A1I2JLX5_9GAMM|nr:M28 family metallopeptidase [Fontimonas thermophila]SFF54970.1 Zn-dependent amino-or carboxypeptidase, M28 family [Fontimonas thermophila]
MPMTSSSSSRCAIVLSAAALGACVALPQPVSAPHAPDAAALASITADDLLAHVRVLASDAFEGRLPGTPGEEKTVAYLVEQFRSMGLAPGNPDGTYVQKVPLVGITGTPDLSLRVGSHRLHLEHGRDYVATTSRAVPEIRIADSELIFVGYGVQAPEYGWDDYKGVDVRGKTLIMLINDPAVPDAQDPSRLDASMFRGKAMTYYGRWTYKYEIASRLGAAAALIVHETGPAGYPWSVVEHSWSGEQFQLATADRNQGNVPVQGWISLDKARELFRAAGQDFDALKTAAVRRDFKPVPLNGQARCTIRNTLREVQSHNVVARLPGTTHPDEHVIYTAHWDHLGRDENLSGDQIFNGALDNATGTAGLLEIAAAYARLPTPPRRSVLFLAVTAEEQGLLGAKYYATHPLYPIEKTVAALNMDGLNPWGPTKDIQVIGIGQNTLEDILADVVAQQGRVITPDAEPEKGFYYRSDHFELAKVGVPALYADGGSEFIGQPADYGAHKRQIYTTRDYHAPSDEIKPDWDLSGAAQDMRLLMEVGWIVANSESWPQWKSGSEFKAIREAHRARE